ncbi:MAG: NAD-dependent epimerase/dehydratase family protein [Planctomycetaceae bacterium]
MDHNDLLLVTGATGLVGSHVAERACRRNIPVRVLVREGSDTKLLDDWGVETIRGDMTDGESLTKAVDGATHVVHCAAKVGDWGPVDDYRAVNVRGVENLLTAADAAGALKRYVHISSLGVYEARDHYGTDETEPPGRKGIDGYTLTKVESERVVQKHVDGGNLAAVILRPGFIYGPRDRTVLPRILEKLKEGKVKFLGSGEQLMNNTFVGNLVDAIFLALETDDVAGETYNITDGKLVSKLEFLNTIADLAGHPRPTKHVPLGVAKLVAGVLEGLWTLLGKTEAPTPSKATIKFLGLNLDYGIQKAKNELGYEPRVAFQDGMAETVAWFQPKSSARGA